MAFIYLLLPKFKHNIAKREKIPPKQNDNMVGHVKVVVDIVVVAFVAICPVRESIPYSLSNA